MARVSKVTIGALCLQRSAALALVSSTRNTTTSSWADAEYADWLETADHVPAWYHGWATKNGKERTSAGHPLRIAVLCSGVLKRYFLHETTSGLIEPLVVEGHSVDYFVALATGDFGAFRPEADKFAPEEELEQATQDKSNIEAARELIHRRVSQAGGRAQVVEFFERESITDERSQAWLRQAMMLGKENVLRKLKPLERLWEQVEKREETQNAKYDFVVFIDDDAMWLRPFSLSFLLQETGAREKQLFSLKCGPNSTTETPESMYLTEYIFIVNRTVAEPWGKQYTILTGSGKGRRVWNLEHFSGNIASTTPGLANIQVGSGLIPMQRGGRIPRKNSTVKVCLHKVCENPAKFFYHEPELNPREFYPCCHWSDYAKHNASIKQWWLKR